jgi:phenol 2-monooxygenase
MAVKDTDTVNGASAPDMVDVLIVGAGPAGLMMAMWMAKCGIKTRIVDKRGTKARPQQSQHLSSQAFD